VTSGVVIYSWIAVDLDEVVPLSLMVLQQCIDACVAGLDTWSFVRIRNCFFCLPAWSS
jgi:hypothetical protein